VEAALVKRMTAGQSLQTHPDAAHGAIFGDGLHHVFGTGGGVTARRRQERRHELFVAPQQGDQDFLHRKSTRLTSLDRSSNDASSAARRGLKTIAQFSSNCDR